jgi:hypothetical protein
MLAFAKKFYDPNFTHKLVDDFERKRDFNPTLDTMSNISDNERESDDGFDDLLERKADNINPDDGFDDLLENEADDINPDDGFDDLLENASYDSNDDLPEGALLHLHFNNQVLNASKLSSWSFKTDSSGSVSFLGWDPKLL